MKEEERGLLARRLESATATSRRMKGIVGTGAALALLLLLVAGFVVQSEIRKRTRTEQELRSTEERYHLLFDSNPIPAWVYDTQSLAILDVNEEAISHYGYSREEFLRFKITDIRPPEDVPAVVESASKASSGAESSGSVTELTKLSLHWPDDCRSPTSESFFWFHIPRLLQLICKPRRE
jgi:PAS domain-containing protein